MAASGGASSSAGIPSSINFSDKSKLRTNNSQLRITHEVFVCDRVVFICPSVAMVIYRLVKVGLRSSRGRQSVTDAPAAENTYFIIINTLSK